MVGGIGIEPMAPTMSTEGPFNDFNGLSELACAEVGLNMLVFAPVAYHLRAGERLFSQVERQLRVGQPTISD